MVVETRSSTPPEAVVVEAMPGGAASCVWLRRGIERDVADQGPDAERAVEFYRADEVGFSVEGVPTADEVAASFDALWAAHEHDGMTDAERIAALAASDSDNSDALAELGDMLAEQADAIAELGDIVANVQGGEQ